MTTGRKRDEPAIALPWRSREGELPLLVLVGLVTVAAYFAVFPLSEKLHLPLYRGLASAVLVTAGYWTLCSLLNTTWMEACGERLVVHHGPLPLRRALRFSRHEIAAVRFRCCTGLEVRLVTGGWRTLLVVGLSRGQELAALLSARLGCADWTRPPGETALVDQDP